MTLTNWQVFGIAMTAQAIARQQTDRIIAAIPEQRCYRELDMPGIQTYGREYNSYCGIPEEGTYLHNQMAEEGRRLIAAEKERATAAQVVKATVVKATYEGRAEPPMTRGKAK